MNKRTLASVVAAMALGLASAAAQAQGSAAEEIAKYRAMLQDGNPAELTVARGTLLPAPDREEAPEGVLHRRRQRRRGALPPALLRRLGRFDCRPTHLPLFARTPRNLESFVLEQDAIFVGGGNTRSMLAVWRDWGLDVHLRTASQQGIVLGGWSAWSICWFEQGITDSIAGPLTALDCLGFLPGSNCPHYNSEPLRRPTYRKMVARGVIADGYAADDGVALHFIDGKLARVVSNHRPARGWRLTRKGRAAVERPLPTRYLAKR